MIDVGQVLTVARTELRLARRLVRYWVFVVLSFLLGLAGYFYYALLHMLASSWSASASMISPRYLISAVATYYLAVFVVGIVFLGFDLRARDTRERMVEVLDSRPYTNLELVLGKFSGLLVAAWIPVAVLALLLQLLGFVLPLLGSPVGEPIEPYSLVTFIVFMTLPCFAFILALVFLVTLLVRHRLIAAVLMLVLLGLMVWGWIVLPLYISPLLDISGGTAVNFPSEIVPSVADGPGWLQRLGFVVASLGLLVLAAAVHPRLDGGSRGRTAAAGAGILVLAGAVLGIVCWQRWQPVAQRQAWLAAHDARAGEAVPDLRSMSVAAAIEPGRSLELEMNIVLAPPPEEALQSVLLTLNPGLEVTSVSSPDAGVLAFTHRDGLLDVDLAVAAGEEAELQIEASGRPDRSFGYLRAARELEAETARDGQIALLGYDRALFDRRFVALMPGVRWLPAAGSESGRDDPRRRPRDLFELELRVELPDGWLAAGPGRRHELEAGAGRAAFRFSPGAPVDGVALLAGRLDSFVATIEGVHMEVLVHPGHRRNLELFADAADEIRGWVAERLREAREIGLEYPYDGFTVVEVPTHLRGFGGGWRLDTVQAPPGIVMMREMGFPTSRFDFPFRNPEQFRDREGGLPRAKRERLQAFFVNDFSGGNIFVGAARNFVHYQTAAAGSDAVALDYMVEHLSTLLLTGTRGYFSAHMFSPELNRAVAAAFQTFFVTRRGGGTFADAVIDAFTNRSEVWDTVLGVSLDELDPWEDPARTVDVLTLKAGAMSASVLDDLGPQQTGAVIAALLEARRGQSFTREDLVAAAATVGHDLSRDLDDWLASTELPGFVAGASEVYRLPDDEDGSPRYQLVLEVRNDEAVAGLLRIDTVVGRGEGSERLSSSPIRLEGRSTVRYGEVVSRPPFYAEVTPYLSLNRESFVVFLPAVDEDRIVREEPFVGSAETEWAPHADEIVVDDLDDGFVVAGSGGRRGVRLGSRGASNGTDAGLPSQVIGVPQARWSRMTDPGAWGRYRHTAAFVRQGKGERTASFAAELPTAGSWDLEIHVPAKRQFLVPKWGTWHLVVNPDAGAQEASFDSAAAEPGWNLVGSFDLDAGAVTVELSDRTDGMIVVADAIRWRRTAGAGNGVVEEPPVSEAEVSSSSG
jgi:ABC-type transport system involved in multi-copper enzyme maturation permease subunit